MGAGGGPWMSLDILKIFWGERWCPNHWVPNSEGVCEISGRVDQKGNPKRRGSLEEWCYDYIFVKMGEMCGGGERDQ